ncbi:gas vesicle protein GvpJ [Nocardioides pocheonensis]|uniref:Gas vesicle protein A n=1 Tax=Nocardioides pocheonensis TaxID=661485 RepID=A0A3N0GJQ5_9ACTN|nr:gas vesicle protein GvpJ [Nocardioides pocheonensis]RNM12707.1 gas vesicle structural protein GvpA [Nocardioides pocheonensis]
MTVMQQSANRYLDRPAPSSLADVIDTILDKGLVIDIYVRVSLVGIELLTIDARIVIASVDTYLRFAQAVNRLDLSEVGDAKGLPDLVQGLTESGAKGKTSGALEGVKEKVGELFGSDDDEDEDEDEGDEEQRQPRAQKKTAQRRPQKRAARSRSQG